MDCGLCKRRFSNFMLSVPDVTDRDWKAFKGADTRFNSSCNLQRNSTLKWCKIGKYAFSLHFADVFFTYHELTSLNSRIALQLARKIASCDSALKANFKNWLYMGIFSDLYYLPKKLSDFDTCTFSHSLSSDYIVRFIWVFGGQFLRKDFGLEKSIDRVLFSQLLLQ